MLSYMLIWEFCWRKWNKYDEALEYFDKSLQYASNFHAIYNTATLYYEQQQYDLSLEWFIKAREFTHSDNKNELKLAELGWATVYEKQEAYDDAIDIYKKYGMAEKVEAWETAKKIKEDNTEAINVPVVNVSNIPIDSPEGPKEGIIFSFNA